ncbi:Protein MAIN-LIKE 1 [Linum perenne]
MSWLRRNFTYVDGSIRDNDTVMIHQYCRAYIVDFFGICVFADCLGAYAHLFLLPLLEDLERAGDYVWGAAALSWIYRELGRNTFQIESDTTGDHNGDIGGCGGPGVGFGDIIFYSSTGSREADMDTRGEDCSAHATMSSTNVVQSTRWVILVV